MASSLCPGCGEHGLNYITRTCEKCGDRYGDTSKADLMLLQELHKALGPLRDALALMVAEHFEEYPNGCTCKDGDTKPRPATGHHDTCPASKNAVRYLEHLFRRKQEREAQVRIEQRTREQAEAIRKAIRGDDVEANPTPEQLEAWSKKLDAAGFTSEWADQFGRITTPEQAARFVHYALGGKPEDLRQRCPECNGPMAPDGDAHVVCKPCGVRLVYDVSDAEVPGTRDIEVWHCPTCDQCYTFRRLDIAPRAVVLAGDGAPPTSCFACGGKLRQWSCYRPFVPTPAFTGDNIEGAIKTSMRGLEADEHAELTMDMVREAAAAMPRDPRGPFPHLAEAERDLLGPAAREPDKADPELLAEYMEGRFGDKRGRG